MHNWQTLQPTWRDDDRRSPVDRPEPPGRRPTGMTVALASPVVSVSGIDKVYGDTVALAGVGLDVAPGEVFGLLGPNGAGKSTMVKMLLGLVHPTAGEARLFGRPAGDPEARRRVGYLPELFRFPAWMTGRKLLRFHADLAGLAVTEADVDAALERVGMSAAAGRKIGTYSKGMSQRIGLAQAILGHPELVLLDEPTSALDPVGRREVRDLIRSLRGDGVAVLLNSHLLGEVEQVCDRIAMLDKGRLIFEGTISELIKGGTRLEVRVNQIPPGLFEMLDPFGEVVRSDSTSFVVALADPSSAADVADTVVRSGARLLALVPESVSLEDVFVGMVRGGDR